MSDLLWAYFLTDGNLPKNIILTLKEQESNQGILYENEKEKKKTERA